MHYKAVAGLDGVNSQFPASAWLKSKIYQQDFISTESVDCARMQKTDVCFIFIIPIFLKKEMYTVVVMEFV